MHSSRKIELFDDVFLYVDPRYITSLSPLLILSVAATVSEDFSAHLRERLHWIDVCLNAIATGVRLSGPQLIRASLLTILVQTSANELQDVLPNVLDVILQRIQHRYMQVSSENFQDPVLKNMHQVARKISELKNLNPA